LHFIKREIDKIVKKYHTRDPFELCDSLKVNCYILDLHKEINGLYQYEKRNQFIYINCNLSDELQKVICAHELGHAILHKKTNCTFLKKNTFFNVDKLEREANLFAAELIIPNDFNNFIGQTLKEISHYLNVPEDLLKLKLDNPLQ
jgi:Zn-dependent peptidase ImmA (M78 family)